MPQPAVIDQLNDAQRQAVEDLLVAFRFRDYDGALDQVNAYLEQTGAPVRFSRGSLHRVGSKLQQRLERLRAASEAARAVVAAAPDERADLSQSVVALIQSDLFDSLNALGAAQDEEDATARIGLLRDAARAAADAGKTSLMVKKHAIEVEARKAALKEAASRIDSAAKDRGLSAEDAAFWRNQVLMGM